MQLNKPNPRLDILRFDAYVKAMGEELARIEYAESAQNPRVSRAAPPDADSLPLPPSYWDDLEHWLKTLAPAKPAATGDAYVSAKQPEPSADVWHSEAPSVAGVYIAAAYDLSVTQRRYWNGCGWSQNWEVTDEASYAARRRGNASCTSDIQWLRLIEADAPAQEKPAKLTHSVCIKAHHGFSGVHWSVGSVATFLPAHAMVPECWRACDADGWIPHTPTANSVCPVPAGVHFETLLFGGFTVLRPTRTVDGGYGGTGDCNCIKWDTGTSVIAWRPIAKDAS